MDASKSVMPRSFSLLVVHLGKPREPKPGQRRVRKSAGGLQGNFSLLIKKDTQEETRPLSFCRRVSYLCGRHHSWDGSWPTGQGPQSRKIGRPWVMALCSCPVRHALPPCFSPYEISGSYCLARFIWSPRTGSILTDKASYP